MRATVEGIVDFAESGGFKKPKGFGNEGSVSAAEFLNAGAFICNASVVVVSFRVDLEFLEFLLVGNENSDQARRHFRRRFPCDSQSGDHLYIDLRTAA
ncbi:MAG: hypothetical protein PSY12_14230 [bacterium]|nr:hypothetical protein [bacterium]